MAKATCVHSTPPTNTPISGATSRRNFLTTVAGIAAGAAAVALAAVPALAVPVDPVFAAIEKFKEARSTLREAEAAHSAAEREFESGDLYPGVLSMTPRLYCASYGNATKPGNTFWPFMRSHAEIDKFSPADQYPEDNKMEHEELAAKILRCDERMIPLQEVMDDAWDAECEALEELVVTIPTTSAGVLAMLQFHREYGEDRHHEWIDAELAASLAESVETGLLNLKTV